MKKLTTRGFTAIALLPFLTPAWAAPVMPSAELEATGSIAFDTATSLITATRQDDNFTVEGMSTDVNNGTVVGFNPLSGSLGSDLTMTSMLSAENTDIDFDFVRYDFDFFFKNKTTNSTAAVTFKYDIAYTLSASARSMDDDAFADATFALFDSNNTEQLFSSYFTELNTGLQTSTDNGQIRFSLNPGDTISFSGFYEANLYTLGNADFSVFTDATFSLSSVEFNRISVSEPTTVAMFFLCSAIAMLRRRSV